jgi:hypothetical protein
MSEESKDDWPGWEYRIVGEKHLHAIGQMNIMYNELEHYVGHLFAKIFPTTEQFADNLFQSLNNRRRTDLFTAIVESVEINKELASAILYALRCYDICTDNRNILMHAVSDAYEPNNETVRLSKRASRQSPHFIEFQLVLSDLRHVADDCAAFASYFGSLMVYVMDHDRAVWAVISGAAPPPLPDRPAPPRRLTPSRPQEDPEDAQSRP